jgi:hypothetical protein
MPATNQPGATPDARSGLFRCRGKRRLHAGMHRIDARVRGARRRDQEFAGDVSDVDSAVVSGFAIEAAGDGFIPVLEIMAANDLWQRGQLWSR